MDPIGIRVVAHRTIVHIDLHLAPKTAVLSLIRSCEVLDTMLRLANV